MSGERGAGIADRLAAALADRYRIERELGAGGMATVYLAHDLKHDRQVAIKVLRPELAAVIGAERFLVEIKTTANLQHPHILPLFDSGIATGTGAGPENEPPNRRTAEYLFYVMPYIEGESLRDRLNREKQLPIADAIRIATEVAGALDYAHRHNVIHRDIKPENILLHDGRALVADFGIALAASKAGGSRMTETGMSLGTPHYMSPEQAMGEREITARSDVYALGCVLYETLLGEPPFTGPTAQAIVAKVMTAEPVSLTGQRKSIPPHVEYAVFTALEKLPADRFESAKAFAEALTNPAFRRATGATVGGLTAQPSNRLTALLALMLALVAVGVAVGWAAGRRGRLGALATEPPTMTSILAPTGGNFGEQRSLAITPDGRRLAFVFAASDGSRMLWLRQLDKLDAEPIPRTTGATAPFWSPDGRSLGYFAAGYLTVLDQNGETRRICPVSGATGGSWSVKGMILFGHSDGISMVPADGGSCTLIVPRAGGPLLKAVFLPDGERFLYSRGREQDMVAAGLDGLELATLPVRAITEFAFVAGHLIVPGRTDIRALDAQRINLRTLALEGPPVRLATDVRSQSGVPTFAVSPSAFAFLPGSNDLPYLEYDARGLLLDTVRVEGTWSLGVRPRRAGPPLVTVGGNVVGLWIYDLDSDRATRLLVRDSTFPTTGMGYGTTFPAFIGDGSRLVYAKTGPGRCRIIERDLATDAERVAVEHTVSDVLQCLLPLDGSPDGKRLLVRQDTSLQIIALDGTPGVQQIVRPGRLWEGRFSPDGGAVAYSSDETGRAEVYIQRLPSGTPIRVSLEGGRWPAWADAGRRLIFMTPDGRVQEVPVTPGADARAGTPRTRFSVSTWRRSTFDDMGTGFAMVGDGERYLVRMSPAGLAVAYVQHWTALLHRGDSTPGMDARP